MVSTDSACRSAIPRVVIIILNWNGLRDTIECLESLRRITYTHYATIVVDNASSGNDVETLTEKYGDCVHIIRNDTNRGFAAGNNIGIQYALEHCRPDYVLLLNNDTVVHPAFLDELVGAATRDPSIGIAGPRVYSYDQPRQLQSAGGRINLWTGDLTLIGWGKAEAGPFDRITDTDWVFGCALMISSRAILDIGLLYEGYFALAEEADWCARCRKAGYRIVCVPSATIWHKGGRAFSPRSGFRLYYVGRNRLLFMKRNASTIQFSVFLPQFFLRHVSWTLMSIISRQRDLRLAASYLRGVCDGLKLALKRL